MKWLVSLLERILGIAGAIIFSQVPLFMLQYTHTMAGHVAELHAQVTAMVKVAMQTGKTLDAFIFKFVASSDADFHAQGELMQAMVQRSQYLEKGLLSLQTASFWQRPFIFLKQLDGSIATETYRSFEPGLPLTPEGLVYALLGLLVATCLFRLVRISLRALFSSKKTGQEPAH